MLEDRDRPQIGGAWNRNHSATFILSDGGGSAMKQIIEQFLQFLQQGIAAIFRFVELVWSGRAIKSTK